MEKWLYTSLLRCSLHYMAYTVEGKIIKICKCVIFIYNLDRKVNLGQPFKKRVLKCTVHSAGWNIKREVMMSGRQRLKIWCFLALCMILFDSNHWTYAQIATDNTLGGPGQLLSGPAYSIGHKLGEIGGSNLFHSFQEFNLKAGESATFTGPATIANIFSRVTGGNPSSIDGLIQSDIKGANFFFMNPAGVMFGQNAQLDVSGSFFVTTADSIEFGDGQSFEATEPQGPPLLTSAPPNAFGFLENNAGTLTINGSNLEVKDNHSLSIVGGDITINDGNLTASDGTINLVSINSQDKASKHQLETSGDSDLFGNITLTNTSAIKTEVSGNAAAAADDDGGGGGDITIKSGNLFIRDSSIQTITKKKEKEGGDILIMAIPGNPLDSSGSMVIEGKKAEISTLTELPGFPRPPPDERSGPGGGITIEADRLDLVNGGSITTLAAQGQSGKGGDIIINVEDKIRIDGKHNSSIANATIIIGQTQGEGDSGNISIHARNLEVLNGGQILANSRNIGNGDPGNLTLDIDQRIVINEFNTILTIVGTPGENIESPGGTVTINTSALEVLDGAEINSNSGLEMGGNIVINTTVLDINAGIISANARNSDGGNIVIKSRDTIQINNSGRVTALAVENGGNIELDSPGRITVTNSEVTANAGNNGGNISMNANEVILDASQITARAQIVSGGNIRISARAFISSSDNVIDVSVADKFGVSGNVEIFSPDIDIAGSLAVLPESFTSRALALQESCAVKLPGDFSSFIVVGKGGIPIEPGGIMPTSGGANN